MRDTLINAGATVLALYLAVHFVFAWAHSIRSNPNPLFTTTARRVRLYWGVFVGVVLFAAIVAVIWS